MFFAVFSFSFYSFSPMWQVIHMLAMPYNYREKHCLSQFTPVTSAASLLKKAQGHFEFSFQVEAIFCSR